MTEYIHEFLELGCGNPGVRKCIILPPTGTTCTFYVKLLNANFHFKKKKDDQFNNLMSAFEKYLQLWI